MHKSIGKKRNSTGIQARNSSDFVWNYSGVISLRFSSLNKPGKILLRVMAYFHRLIKYTKCPIEEYNFFHWSKRNPEKLDNLICTLFKIGPRDSPQMYKLSQRENTMAGICTSSPVRAHVFEAVYTLFIIHIIPKLIRRKTYLIMEVLTCFFLKSVLCISNILIENYTRHMMTVQPALNQRNLHSSWTTGYIKKLSSAST